MSLLLMAIQAAINARKGPTLDLAQASMSDRQFEAFRRLFLRQFGKEGLEADLARVVAEHERARKGRE
jgi:hypothetical protein